MVLCEGLGTRGEVTDAAMLVRPSLIQLDANAAGLGRL